jgi:hypothetical protein
MQWVRSERSRVVRKPLHLLVKIHIFMPEIDGEWTVNRPIPTLASSSNCVCSKELGV